MTIETVDVGWCKEITDRGATQIAQRSKSLRYLGLMRCDQVRSLCLSWCLSLSVGVFLCECEGGSRIYVFLNVFTIEHIHYIYTVFTTVLVCCVHICSSKATQRTRRSVISVC